MEIIDPPKSLQPLIELLDASGFALVSDDSDTLVLGDRRFRWTRHDLWLQVTLDRGRWFVDVMPAGRDDWMGYGLEIVIDTLDDVERFTHLLTLKDATEILRNRLDEIVELMASKAGLELIDDKHHERALRWFGA